MRRALAIVAIGILLGLGIIWLVMSQTLPPQERPVMDGIRRPNLPAR
jgi:hypothetical protein